MSVSKMKRLTVFAPKGKLDELMKKLVRLRCVDISSSDPDAFGDELELTRLNCDSRRLELEASLSETDEAIKALNYYVKKFKGFFPQKKQIDIDSFVAKGHAEKAKKIVFETLEVQKRKNKIKEELNKCNELIVAATPYTNYELPLGLTQTESTEIFLGVLPVATNTADLGKELYEAGAVSEILRDDKTGVFGCFVCHKSDSAAVNSILTSHGFLRASFPGEKLTAVDCVRESQRRIKFLLAEDDQLKDKLSKLAQMLDWVEVLYDVEATELVAIEQKLKLVATDSVAIIDAWVPAKREVALNDFLEKFECAYEMRDPEGEEIPPILLENNGFATNFEWVLEMYSYPAYGKFDPTFIMSIFYFIIFGIMFADAGYGLVLLLACFGAVKFLKPSDSMKRFLKMFGYCGISCIFFGVLFGAYFGDFPLAIMREFFGMTEEQLPNLALLGSSAANLAVWFDPLQEPMNFLIFSLAIGAIHLIAGMAVQFITLCKNGKVWDAIFDVGAYWLLFGGIGLLFVSKTVGICVTAAAALLIVLTHGRGEKKFLMKIAKGFLGLYDLINYAADLLSYSRILALGLAASIIGQVVNILGTMIGPNVIGFIVLVVVFIVGHVLNLLINVLGTFVHTSRLQYIEFFGKFYEDGGVPFEPAEPSEKFTQPMIEKTNKVKTKKVKANKAKKQLKGDN